jgi:NitT/TauT family transport system substrate-binding protein
MFQELDDKRVRTVLNSYDVLGGPHTFNVISTTKGFYEANPRINRAVLAALEEADEFIRKNRKGAAEIYIRNSGTKESLADLLSQLNSPSLGYSTTPLNVTKFSDFMYQTGTIKARPKDWKELFFPAVHGKKGS